MSNESVTAHTHPPPRLRRRKVRAEEGRVDSWLAEQMQKIRHGLDHYCPPIGMSSAGIVLLIKVRSSNQSPSVRRPQKLALVEMR
jgi:hypothetical protein